MSATTSADFVFTPKVWKDHIDAFFRRKLVAGSIASNDDTLTSAPGTTINFPYFKKIGAAEEPLEDAGLVVDKLSDDSFSATVKEVSKAVGIKKKAFKTSAAAADRIISEVQRQIGRVMAEKIDADLITEFSTNGNFTSGFLATTDATDRMNVRNLNKGRISAFGDQFGDAKVAFMHSVQFLDLMNDSTTGFLQANAVDPMFMVEGYQGRLLGMAIVVNDNMGGGGVIDGKNSYDCYLHKENPYGFLVKQDMEVESDYDILHREWVFTGDQWYAVKSFHAKVDANDLKTCRVRTTGSI
jgi:N4-gp56 family major capsid protein